MALWLRSSIPPSSQATSDEISNVKGGDESLLGLHPEDVVTCSVPRKGKKQTDNREATSGGNEDEPSFVTKEFKEMDYCQMLNRYGCETCFMIRLIFSCVV